MVELARSYHQGLQNDAEPQPTDEERHREIRCSLKAIPPTQTFENPWESNLNGLISENNVRNALKLTKNTMATGTDGCPYELWKALENRYNEDTAAGRESLNIIKVLIIVYRDIQANGLDDASNFALGWMCPIYKKKDPTEISNYCPITFMNTDYKILTK